MMRRGPSPAIDEVAEVAALLSQAVSEIFDGLDTLANATVRTYESVVRRGGRFTPKDLGSLRPLILEQLRRRSFVDGVGILTSDDLFEDRLRHIEWWRQDVDEVKPLWLNFDPASMDFYDYLTMEWFVRAQRERARSVFGPYVDSRCADHYIVTLATPIVADRFLGVVGADVRMSLFEESFAPVLYELDCDLILVNEERRVVMTNSARWLVGERLKSLPRVEDDDVYFVTPVGPNGTWLLAAIA